jgi:hypothetical protein
MVFPSRLLGSRLQWMLVLPRENAWATKRTVKKDWGGGSAMATFRAAKRELASNQLQANPLISNLSGCTSMTIRLTPWPSSSSNTPTGSAFEESSPPMTSRELQWYVSGSLCGSHPSEGDRDIASLKPRVRHQVDAAFNRSHNLGPATF